MISPLSPELTIALRLFQQSDDYQVLWAGTITPPQADEALSQAFIAGATAMFAERDTYRDLCRELARVLRNTNDLYEELQGHPTSYSREAREALSRARNAGIEP